MTTTKTIVAYEIIAELYNKRDTYNAKAPGGRKNSVGRFTNGHIHCSPNNAQGGGWMTMNPLQARAKNSSTPVFAVYEDGTREKVSSHSFFYQFSKAPWVELKCSSITVIAPEKQEDGTFLESTLEGSGELAEDMWNPERSERPSHLKWIIPATSRQEFEACFVDRGVLERKTNGNKIHCMEFKGRIELMYDSNTNLNPIKLPSWPLTVLTDAEYDQENPLGTNPMISAPKQTAAEHNEALVAKAMPASKPVVKVAAKEVIQAPTKLSPAQALAAEMEKAHPELVAKSEALEPEPVEQIAQPFAKETAARAKVSAAIAEMSEEEILAQFDGQ